ncbi:MAG: ATP-binding protein [Acidobacteria bacterium]|nr:ATP-binding protein [Acidobacteriota bacterium]
MRDHPSIEITMASRVEFVNLVHAANDEVCRLLDFDEDTTMNLSLALHEATVNAIKHGNRLDSSKTVSVIFQMRPGELEVTIRDQGNGFDAARPEDPRAARNLEKTNGRGLFLMRSFMDRVEFRHVPGEGMVVSLMKRVPAKRAGAEGEGGE